MTTAPATLPAELGEWLTEIWPATEPGTRFEPGPLNDLDADQVVDYLDALDSALFALKCRHAEVREAAEALVDRPIVSRRSGRVWAPTGSMKRTGWNKRKIGQLIEQQRSRLLVDPETGDQIRAYPAGELGDLIEVKTGVNVARGLGVKTGDLCTEQWVGTIGLAK